MEIDLQLDLTNEFVSHPGSEMFLSGLYSVYSEAIKGCSCKTS